MGGGGVAARGLMEAAEKVLVLYASETVVDEDHSKRSFFFAFIQLLKRLCL